MSSQESKWNFVVSPPWVWLTLSLGCAYFSSSARFDAGGRLIQVEVERASVEKRFAYQLLEKLLMYLEYAAGKMKPVKPSQAFSRRNSFKKASKDVKFFGKVSVSFSSTVKVSGRKCAMIAGCSSTNHSIPASSSQLFSG